MPHSEQVYLDLSLLLSIPSLNFLVLPSAIVRAGVVGVVGVVSLPIEGGVGEDVDSEEECSVGGVNGNSLREELL